MSVSAIQPGFNPLPDPAAVVLGPNIRFTLLSSRLIRMEYSPSGEFEDRPSQAFWYRRQPAPSYELRATSTSIEIETEHLYLHYSLRSGPFSPTGLTILVKATGATWRPGIPPRRAENLWGAARTLDEATGAIPLEPGLISRQGWSLVDDSKSLVFDETGWIAPRAHPENQDWYFFGYGHDYPACLADFTRIAGRTPMVPRWIFGNWWSRYWAYSADELLALMEEFRQHAVPLSVCIVDMDWHITETGNLSTGWTGYTWNNDLFPDPEGFLAALHALGLRVALNLHPAEGIHPHEARYAELATFLGQDPSEGEPVRFNCASPRFIQGYFELLHHPLEAQGVDFWWLDWQQGGDSGMPGLDPLWWLNHLHFYDLARDGVKRPFIFSRWGGLGNHRYPIGFSGDAVITWDSLDFQPAFTSAAANVGYGWWSHDIGGHMGGIEDDELYARWVQWGAFSPVLRLHSTNNPYHERRPWGRGPAAAKAASAAMRLRHALVPYIYTMAWRNYSSSLPMVTAMYYSHPESAEAYTCHRQYWFGGELVCAPFTRPAEPSLGLARQVVWLPEGCWFNFFTGEQLPAGWRTIYGGLDDIPVFAPAGAIIPLASATAGGGVENPTALDLFIFPGADHRFELYEDDGETNAYLDGRYALTPFSQEWAGNTLDFRIHPEIGDAGQIPGERTYHLHFRGICHPEEISVARNGRLLQIQAAYDPETDTLALDPVTLTPADELIVRLATAEASLFSSRSRTLGHLRKLLFPMRVDSWVKSWIEGAWPSIQSGQISLHSFSALNEAQTAALESLRSSPGSG